MTRVNFTGRVKVPHHIVVAVGRYVDRRPVATVYPDLGSLSLAPDAHVAVEFYRRTTVVRCDGGTVENVQPVTYHYEEFGQPEGVLVRIKVISTSRVSQGRLLAVGDRIKVQWEDTPGGAQSLLPFRSEPGLGSRVWELDLNDEPVVLMNEGLADWNATARSEWFVALAYPEILRRIARWVAGGEEDDEGPGNDWAVFLEDLTGESVPYDKDDDEVEEWAVRAVNRFASRHDLLAMIHSVETTEEGH